MEAAVEEPSKFPEGLKALDKVCQLLYCSKCKNLPAREVFLLGNCLHKYCRGCGEQLKGEPCVVCKQRGRESGLLKDDTSSSLLVALLNLHNAFTGKGDVETIETSKEKDKPQEEEKSGQEENVTPMEVDNDAIKKEEDKIEKKKNVESVETSLENISKTLKAVDFDANENEEKTDNKNNVEMNVEASVDVENTPKTPKAKSRAVKKKEEPQIAMTMTTRRRSAKRPLNVSQETIDGPKPKSVHFDKFNDTPVVTAVTPVRKRLGRSLNSSQVSSSVSSPASLASTSFSSTTPVNKKNAKGETPLHVACKTGQVDKARKLIQAGADVNAQDHAGWTPLHEAVNGKKATPSCKFELVRLLCEEGECNLNIPGMENETVLHEAARSGLNEIVAYLLDRGASPNVRNQDGKLPRDVCNLPAILQIFEKATTTSATSSQNLGTVEDPVVLEIQFKNALIFFTYKISPDIRSKVENELKLKISKDFRGNVTHVIFPSESIGAEKKVSFSFAYLQGIANGAWMLSSEWIEKSLSAMHPLSPVEFEILGCTELDSETNPPKCARLNKEIGNPGLFHGICFYVYKNSTCQGISKKDLTALVKLAGGEVINRDPNPKFVDPLEHPIRFHAKEDNHKLTLTSHILLYDDKNKPPEAKMYNMEHIKALKTKWLIDSIENFALMDPDNYYI